MSDDEINMAIAGVMGWKVDVKNQGCWIPQGKEPSNAFYYTAKPPDYCNDLNAMHEAEKILDGGQQVVYCQLLQVVQDAPEWAYIVLAFATASQRAEAFLRTLNLWKQS